MTSVRDPLRGVLAFSMGHRRLVMSAAVCLAAIATPLALRVRLDADVLRLLPRQGPAIQAFQTYLATFGSLDHLYVVFRAPEGESVAETDAFVSAYLERARRLDDIERVDAGILDPRKDWAYLADRQLLLLGPGGIGDAVARLRPDAMAARMSEVRSLLSLPSPQLKALVQQDPLGFGQLLRSRLGAALGSANLEPTATGYVSVDGRSRLVTVKPTRPPYDTAFSGRLLDELAQVEREARTDVEAGGEAGAARVTVDIAGGHRVSYETEVSVRREMVGNSVASLIGILGVMLFTFRQPMVVLLGSVPMVVSVVLVLASSAVFGLTLSAANAGASAMLFGLGDDGIVLLLVAYRHLAESDPVARLRGPAVSTLLAAATTAATFFGLCFIDFPSLQELGVLVGSGMLVCGALTLFFVPALVASHRPRPPLTMTRFARVTMASPRAVLGAAAVLTVASAWGARFLALDPTLERLRPTTPAAAIEERLMTDFGLPRDVYLVLARGRDLDRLLAENERLVDALGRERMAWRVSAPSHLMPSAERQREAAAVVAQTPRVEVVREELARAADESGFRPEIFAPFTERLPRLLDATASIDYDGYRAHGLTDLVDRYVARDGDDYVLSTYLAAAGLDVPMVAPHIERAIAATGAPMRLTGLPVVNAELASRFAPEFFRGLAIGSAIVVALIALTFRRLSDTCLALVPVGLALVWSAGLLAWWHVDLDLFSMFAVITFLGIGVDYAIHLIERYREHPEAGVVDALAHVAPAVIVAGSTTLIGFGTLAASSYGPLHSLGVVSLVTIAAAMLSSLVVLPALLAFTASSASTRPRRQPPTATPDSTETGTHERTDHADSSAQRR